MTANGFEKQPKSAGTAPALPHLTVLRDTWCSQQAADAAIDFLQAHNPELIQEIMIEEGASRSHDYFSLAQEAVDYLAESGQPVPDTFLGKLDLAFELSRRIRKARGFAEFKLRGHPAAAASDKMPPLPALEVSESATRRGNVTQALADKILGASYAARPDLWYAAAEEYRRELCIYATDALREDLKKRVDADFGPAKNSWTAGEMFIEAVRRIYKMCGIET